MRENILITGGAGFIGSSLADFYCTTYNIFIVDDLSMGVTENIPTKNVKFIKGSVTDAELVSHLLQSTSFKYIFHFAAVASVADSVERPVETHQVNFESVLQLLEGVRKYQPKLERLVFTSSAAVYGDEPTLPKCEESVIRPLTPYAIDKFAAEKYVLAYNRLYDVPTSAVRFFNVYGPRQNPRSPYSGVISILVDAFKKNKSGKKGSFIIYGDGNQSRDFIYIEDVIQAIDLIVSKSEAKGEIYNIGNGQSYSLKKLISLMEAKIGNQLELKYEEKRNGDILESVADITKIQQLGYSSNYTLEQGITQYLKEVNII